VGVTPDAATTARSAGARLIHRHNKSRKLAQAGEVFTIQSSLWHVRENTVGWRVKEADHYPAEWGWPQSSRCRCMQWRGGDWRSYSMTLLGHDV
jgi:hypothetical protein